MTTQEVLSEQMLIGPVIDSLNRSRGVVDVPLEQAGIDPEQRANLSVMARILGKELAPMAADPTTDKHLDIYRKNFEQASVPGIESGLYIQPNHIRRKKGDLLVVIGHQTTELVGMKGVVLPSTGVVFPKEEFKVVARNAKDFVKHVRAQTLNAHREDEDRDEADATADRSAAHSMNAKISGLNSLETSLIEEFDVLSKIFRQSLSPWRAQYKAKNLDRDRKRADEIIHNAAETASVTWNHGTVVINAIHRVIASNLYRCGSSREIARQWALYTAMAGRYANARRGKVSQSRKDCEEQLAIYIPALETKATEAEHAA